MSALDQLDLGPQLGAKRRRDHQGWSRVTTIPRLSDLWEHHWGYRSSQPCDLLCRLIWSGARLAYTRPRAAASLQSRSVRLIERINVINKFSDIAKTQGASVSVRPCEWRRPVLRRPMRQPVIRRTAFRAGVSCDRTSLTRCCVSSSHVLINRLVILRKSSALTNHARRAAAC